MGLIGLLSTLLCAGLWSWGLISHLERGNLDQSKCLQNGFRKLCCAQHESWWTICCREPFHGAATRSRDSLPMYHLSPTRVPSVRKQHCFISFAILFHIFPLVIYCLLHQWNHRVTGYEFCNRVEPKLEPKPITTSTREGPNPCLNLNGGLAKPPLKLRHGWVITSISFMGCNYVT